MSGMAMVACAAASKQLSSRNAMNYSFESFPVELCPAKTEKRTPLPRGQPASVLTRDAERRRQQLAGPPKSWNSHETRESAYGLAGIAGPKYDFG